MKDSTIARIVGSFVLICAIFAVVAVESVRNINRSADTSDWVNHTHAVIIAVNEVLGDMHASDGSALSFALAGDPKNKAACRGSLADLAEHMAVAKALTRNEPAQQALVLRLEALTDARSELDRDILRASGLDAVRAILGPDAGAGKAAEIRDTVDELGNQEMALLDARDRASFVQARTTRWTVLAGFGIDLVLFAGVGWLIADDIKARRRAATVLREANEQLDAKVKERTAELASANQQLSVDIVERRWANQALDHQLRYNQLIINSITDLVFVLTKAVNISRINPAVVRLTGLESQELLNRPFSAVVRLVDAGGGAPLVDPIARALIDGRDLHDQPAVIEDKRGGKTTARLALYPLRDQDKVVGGVAILQLLPPV